MLSREDREVLALAGRLVAGEGRGREATVIRDALGVSASVFWGRAYRLLDDPDAWAADPVVMGVLARRVTPRRRSRSGRSGYGG